ncbi:MAG: hypothetical protein ACYDCL_14120 [Myxococcales bacterium]
MAAGVAGLACQNLPPPAPMPLAVTPSEAYQNQTVQLRITGQGFLPYVKANFLAQRQSSLDTAFAAWLGTTPLVAVALQGDGSLSATVPQGLTPGTYDLTVLDPGPGSAAQRTGTLAGAFLVLSGQACDAGPSCLVCGGLTATKCGDRCVDPATDGQNCGGCGQSCSSDQVCSGGVCASSCSSPYATCPDGGYCAATLVDPSNCGGCGVLCPPAAPLCSGGSCSAACVAPYGECGQGPSAFCADFAADSANCGGCGVACELGSQCVGGACAPTCAPPLGTLCGGHCVDVLTDSLNCGGCQALPADAGGGVACPEGQSCNDGGCTCPGVKPDLCGSAPQTYCTSVMDDPANCGACGSRCNAGLACCAGSCVDLSSDVGNCLGCGNACPAAQYCAADAGCTALPAQCFDGGAIPLDGDARASQGKGCSPTASIPCDDAGPSGCVQDTLLDPSCAGPTWFYFVSDAGHDQLYVPPDGGAPSAGACNTLESGWLASPQAPTAVGTPAQGVVCFAAESPQGLDPCFWAVVVQILNCGPVASPRYVYQLPNFPGYCLGGSCQAGSGSEIGAYCTR